MSPPVTVETCLAEAIGSLGQESFAAALWALCQVLAAPDNLIVMGYRDAGPPLVLLSRAENPQVFARLQTGYLAGAYRLDPYFDLHLTRAGEGAYRIRDIAPDAFQRSRYFTEYFGATTLIDEIAFVLPLARAEWRGLERSTGPVEDTPALLIRAAARQGIALSPRQAMVALLILRGHSTPSIALKLGVSPQTVKVFRKQLYQRCGISSQAELFSLLLPLLG